MAKYVIEVDIEEGVDREGNPRSEEKVENYIRLSTQQALVKANCLINSVKVKKSAARVAGAPRGKGTAGRKPINRPKIEAWIRRNVEAGPSTQGTTGLNGVDRDGRPLIESKNRIYPHILLQPEPEGVGLSMPAIVKVMGELEIEGYVERGFAAGSPFYELIRPLEEDGQVGVRGREIDDDEVDDIMDAPRQRIKRAEPRVIDFNSLPDDELNID